MSEILRLDGVERRYRSKGRNLVAVADFSLGIEEGEVTCLVGESGCGKTTVGRIMSGLLEPSGGNVSYRGQRIDRMSRRMRARYRLAVQYVHQDPYASLIPSQTVRQTLAAPLRRHGHRRDVDARVIEILETVGLTPAAEIARAYPGELSGGQRQRVSIARALTVDPDVLVADEAVSMIDVSMRLSVLDTLLSLMERRRLTLVLITHDLGAARYAAAGGRIGVMYLGRLVELGPAQSILSDPIHPYTRALVSAARMADPSERYLRASLATEVPSPVDLPPGCSFHPRCPDAVRGWCDTTKPSLLPVGPHQVACHVAAEQHGHPAVTRPSSSRNQSESRRP
jgi:peptide/nickel transport system ATP-binding protein